ncbi:MAG: S8 family peptidase [Bacteroidetes bacterium]|nr:S8 family peptidase [Bacteroidota bacterium]
MNKNKLFLLLSFFGIVTSINAQTKYWVRLNNKNGGNPYTLSNPSAFLTPAAIQRRTTYNVPYHITDLPVTPSYVSQISAVPSVTVLYVSKWLNGVVVSITNTASAMPIINSFTFVASTGVVNKYKLDMPVIEQPVFMPEQEMRANPTTTFNYGGSYWQNKQLNVDCIHSQGFRGQGMVIAVLDAGFLNANINPVFDSLFNRGGVLGTRDFVSGGTNVYDDDAHGEMVLSCMAAIKPGVIMGSAPRANYWLLRTEDAPTEKLIEEYNWIRGAEFADSVGAQVLTTSLGYTQFDNPAQNHTFADLDGKTAPMSIAANLAARKGLLVLNAAGNGNGSSWPKVGIPADADSICTVGAIDSLSNVTGFSSIGPTADGRIKPDLVARGGNSWVSAANSSAACFQANGTSFATPILAGAMTCFWQAHPYLNSFKVLDTLKKTASNFAIPNNSRGWGTPNMCAVPITTVFKNHTLNSSVFNFTVSPNPFNSIVQINLTPIYYTSINIQIYNTLGAIIKTINPPASMLNYEYDFSDITSGVYFIKISTSQGTIIKKVIRQ